MPKLLETIRFCHYLTFISREKIVSFVSDFLEERYLTAITGSKIARCPIVT